MILVVLGVCAGAFVLAGASEKQGAEGRTYKIMFDNAFGLTKGGDFRVGGVNAGQTTAFEVVKKKGESPKAVVTVDVTRSRASATSARTRAARSVPQSLIGEYYVDCQPGKSPEHLRTAAPSRSSRPPRRSRSTSSTTSCGVPTASASAC